MEVKYFDALYNNHRQTTETMRKLRLQAQAILEEADKMQQRNSLVKKEINRHVATIANSELRKRLSYPRKVYPRPPLPFVRNTFPLSLSNQRTSNLAPHIFPSRSLRCFECDSPNHLKWNCPHYRCRFCKQMTPGHSQRDCPQNPNNVSRYEDGMRGHFDIEGDEGNLRGEC